MEYIFSLEEVTGFEKVEGLIDLTYLDIKVLPNTDKDVVEDFNYYLAILKRFNKQIDKFNRNKVINYLFYKIKEFMACMIREHSWEYYRSYFGPSSYDEKDEIKVSFKFKDKYLDFNDWCIYDKQGDDYVLDTSVGLYEYLNKMNIEEKDLNEISVIITEKEYSEIVKILKTKNNGITDENINSEIRKIAMKQIPDLNDCNDIFFEYVEQEEIDSFLTNTSDLKDFHEFVRKNKQ